MFLMTCLFISYICNVLYSVTFIFSSTGFTTQYISVLLFMYILQDQDFQHRGMLNSLRVAGAREWGLPIFLRSRLGLKKELWIGGVGAFPIIFFMTFYLLCSMSFLSVFYSDLLLFIPVLLFSQHSIYQCYYVVGIVRHNQSNNGV